MKRAGRAAAGLILVMVLILLGSSVVITYPDEYQLIRQFGDSLCTDERFRPQGTADL